VEHEDDVRAAARLDRPDDPGREQVGVDPLQPDPRPRLPRVGGELALELHVRLGDEIDPLQQVDRRRPGARRRASGGENSAEAGGDRQAGGAGALDKRPTVDRPDPERPHASILRLRRRPSPPGPRVTIGRGRPPRPLGSEENP
jgi:hypothetical protein